MTDTLEFPRGMEPPLGYNGLMPGEYYKVVINQARFDRMLFVRTLEYARDNKKGYAWLIEAVLEGKWANDATS